MSNNMYKIYIYKIRPSSVRSPVSGWFPGRKHLSCNQPFFPNRAKAAGHWSVPGDEHALPILVLLPTRSLQ